MARRPGTRTRRLARGGAFTAWLVAGLTTLLLLIAALAYLQTDNAPVDDSHSPQEIR